MTQMAGGDGSGARASRAVPFAPAAEPPLPLPQRSIVSPGAKALARIGIVAAAGMTLASALAGHDAPALHAAGPVMLVAHADDRTRIRPRMQPLADRAVAMRERPQQSRTFALDWVGKPRESDATLAMVPMARGSGIHQPLTFTARPKARHFRVLAAATVVDGRTLTDGVFRIRLRDVALPAEQDMCVMLNGEAQPCAERLATQLELMVRWRQVVCEYEPAASSEAETGAVVGACRIGNTDLAARLAEVSRHTRKADRVAAADRAAAL